MASIFDRFKKMQPTSKEPENNVSEEKVSDGSDTSLGRGAKLLQGIRQLQEDYLQNKLNETSKKAWSQFLESFISRVLYAYHTCMPEGHSVIVLLLADDTWQLATPIYRKGVEIPHVFISAQGASFFEMGPDEGAAPLETLEVFTVLMQNMEEKRLFKYKVVGLNALNPEQGSIQIVPAILLEPPSPLEENPS